MRIAKCVRARPCAGRDTETTDENVVHVRFMFDAFNMHI